MVALRLAALGLSHETNTFARRPTDLEMIRRQGIMRGGEIERAFRNSHATMAGFLDAPERLGVEVVPLLFANPMPSGTITDDAFEVIVGEMLDLLTSLGPWDGVLMAQHGAAVAASYPDADGEVTARVRSLVGPATPIGVAIDMHANISERLVAESTVLVVYRTNPHLDSRQRALECAELIVRTCSGDIHPVQALETPPVVISILKQFTGEEPMAGIMRSLDKVIKRPRILSASVAEGYPYADVPAMGMSFVAIADGDMRAARSAARSLAEDAWTARAKFIADAPSPEEALRVAARERRGPVVLMDVGDNIGGGGPGDSTHLLVAARRLSVRRYLQTLLDAEAVQACIQAGIGSTVTVSVGAKSDDRHGEPVKVSGRVRVLADGKFEDPNPTHGGVRFYDQGPTAVLETDEEHTLVLTSRLVGNVSLQQLYSIGVRPETYRVVVAKGVVSPRPAYQPIAARIILVNTPGVTSADLSQFPYRRRRRPLYPFELEAAF